MTHAEAESLLAEAFRLEPRLGFLAHVQAACPGAEWHVVGGAVRDVLLGRERKDIDLVVRHADLDALTDALAPLGDVNLVGRTFGVLKFRAFGADHEVDIAWPRTELAGMSGGYRDFRVQSDADLPIERDLGRRDFTVNALAFRVDEGTLADPYGGLADVDARRIRAVGEPALRFAEDRSRMLRALRFACQLGFDVEPATWSALCCLMPGIDESREIPGDGAARRERIVPPETVAKEFVRAFAADPSRAAELFESSGALFRLIPELRPLSSCMQSPDHHAEGDVWTHTKMALAAFGGPAFAATFPGAVPDAVTVLATLFHDIGKPATAAAQGNHITFYGHAERGAEMVAAIADRLLLASAGADPAQLSWLVRFHLFPNMVDLDAVKRTTLAKYFLADRTAGRRLLHLACADAAGSSRGEGVPVDLTTLHKLIAALHLIEKRDAPTGGKSLLSGEQVMAATGIGPGPAVGALLARLREAQLSGEVSDIEKARELIRAFHADAGSADGAPT